MKFDELKEVAFLNCTKADEKERLNQEIDLFEKRGWKDFVAFIATIIIENEKKHEYFSYSKSSMNSYFIYKVVNGKEYNKRLLNKQRGKEILFNDALRFDCRTVCANINKPISYVNNLFETYIKDFNLFKNECTPRKTKRGCKEKLILTKHPLTPEEFDVFKNEIKETNDSILYEGLIINIEICVGLVINVDACVGL